MAADATLVPTPAPLHPYAPPPVDPRVIVAVQTVHTVLGAPTAFDLVTAVDGVVIATDIALFITADIAAVARDAMPSSPLSLLQ